MILIFRTLNCKQLSHLQKKIKLHFKLTTSYNDGTPVDPDAFVQVKDYFLDEYGGLSIDNPMTGYWRYSGITYTDQTIEFMILVEKTRFDSNVEPNLLSEINKFKEQFKQLEILCYYHEVTST